MQNYANLQAELNRVFQEPLSDLIARSNPFLNALTKRAVASDRIYLKFKLASNHGAQPVQDGTEVTFTGDEKSDYGAGVLDWATYISKFKLPKRMISQLASQPGVLGQIMQEEISDAAKDLADRIASDLWKGVTTDGLVGVQAILDDDNTYAGVNRALAANANWRSTVVDAANGGATAGELSTGLLYSADDAFYAKNYYGFREQPGLFTGMVSPLILTKYTSLLESIDASSLSTAHFVNQANTSGNLGYNNVGFLGVPLMRNHNISNDALDIADTGRMYLMDMRHIFLATLTPSADSLVHQVRGAQTAPTVDGIRAEIEILGNKGEVIEGYIKTYVQLVSDKPKSAGILIKNINISDV